MKNFDELYKDVHTCRKLLKLFHPDCPDVPDVTMRKICGPGNYNWQQIRGTIKHYGYVDICMQNGHDTSGTMGPGWTLKDFKKKVKEGALEFNVWRIVDDCGYKTTDYTIPNAFKLQQVESSKMRELYSDIFLHAGYRTQTAYEWYNYYFKD